MSTKVGFEGKLYVQTGGLGGSGSMTEVTRAKNVEFTSDVGEADNTARNTGGQKSTQAGTIDGTMTFDLVYDESDAVLAAIRTAWSARSVIGMRMLDESSGEGPEADFVITQFQKQESHDETQMVSITAKWSYVDTAFSWHTSG